MGHRYYATDEHQVFQQQHDIKKKKTVLFMPIDAIGHIHSLVGIADSMKRRGHRTVFLFQKPVDCGLSKTGHEVYDCVDEGLTSSVPTQGLAIKKWDIEFGSLSELAIDGSRVEKTVTWIKFFFTKLMQDVIDNEPMFAKKIELINPDVIISDQTFVPMPIVKCGKPWALINSPQPLCLHPDEDNLPPAFAGLHTNMFDTSLVDEKEQQSYIELEKHIHIVDQYRSIRPYLREAWREHLVLRHKYEIELDQSNSAFIPPISPYLNIYMYPEELDYEPVVKNWVRCDSILRNNTNFDDTDPSNEGSKFEMPAQLRDKPGKLIFFSMGTMATSDVTLMKRLVSILAKSPHKFIVCRGPNWDQWDLGDNMWGEKYVDQLSVLPQVDLIITNGGNNTITECLYYGVPGIIVCPVFLDQLDNAQRIEECQLGKRVDPFKCTEQELLDAIEQILADDGIGSRMRLISKRMQSAENKYKALRLLTKFVEEQPSNLGK